jgi:hypothetical protein
MCTNHRNNILDFKLLNNLEDADPIEVHLKSYVDEYLAQFPAERSTIQEALSEMLEAYYEDMERFKRVGYYFKGQRYQQQIFANATSWYDLVWDVGVLNEMIDQEQVRPQTFSVSTLYQSHIPSKTIEEKHLPYALENDEPIILVEFPMIPQQCLVVDGNRRISSRYRKGRKEILGYLLHQDQHLHAMPMAFHQRLYHFHRRLFEQQVQ